MPFILPQNLHLLYSLTVRLVSFDPTVQWTTPPKRIPLADDVGSGYYPSIRLLAGRDKLGFSAPRVP